MDSGSVCGGDDEVCCVFMGLRISVDCRFKYYYVGNGDDYVNGWFERCFSDVEGVCGGCVVVVYCDVNCGCSDK